MTDEDLIYFSRFMLYCENEVRNNWYGFDIKNKQLQHFIKVVGISLKKGGQVENNNTICYKIICKNKKKLATCASILLHIRNAFAHGQLTRKGNIYVIMDKNGKGELTMHGRINADLLPQLIDSIKQTRKGY